MKQGVDAMFPQGAGLVAQLRSPSSAATGTVHIYEFRDGIQVQLTINNLYPGEYQIAFHERGNCSSPNLFSAGAPWAPPGWTKPPAQLLPAFLANNEGNQNGYVAFVRDVKLEALIGRSIVVHWGRSVSEAFPGQPNNRMACGVIEPGHEI
jgi:Cu/Zn superoxide dismutase